MKVGLAWAVFQAEGKPVQRPWGRKELGTCLEACVVGTGGIRCSGNTEAYKGSGQTRLLGLFSGTWKTEEG